MELNDIRKNFILTTTGEPKYIFLLSEKINLNLFLSVLYLIIT